MFEQLWAQVVAVGHWIECKMGLHDCDDTAPTDGAPSDTGAPADAPAPTAAPAVPVTRAQTPAPTSAAWGARVGPVAERLARLWTEGTADPGPMSPAAQELLLAQAVLESSIAEPGGGGGWKDEMVGSGNLGARQGDQSEQSGTPKNPGYKLVEYGDSKPNRDGSQTSYRVKFRYYIDDQGRPAGDWAALDFLKSIRQFSSPAGAVIQAAQAGDLNAYATALYRGHYYGGFGATDEQRIAGYVKGLSAALPGVASALGHDHVYAGSPTPNA